MRRVLMLRGQVQARDRSDTRQGLSPEPHGRHPLQVFKRSNLAGRMPLEAQRQFITAHTRTVIHYAYCPLAALLQFDFHPVCTRVQTVFHQFLDHRGRPLNHFAGGNLVNQVVWEWFDVHLPDILYSKVTSVPLNLSPLH